jgi:hypothetical protein
MLIPARGRSLIVPPIVGRAIADARGARFPTLATCGNLWTAARDPGLIAQSVAIRLIA